MTITNTTAKEMAKVIWPVVNILIKLPCKSIILGSEYDS